MITLLTLALTVVTVWNISMTYRLYKIRSFNSDTIKALTVITKSISELVRLIGETVDMVNEHTDRIVDIENELDKETV